MKKYLLSFLMLCIVMACIPCAFIAKATESACVIRGNQVTVLPNSTATVTLEIENNPGIIGAEIIVSYDERLTLIGAESGDAFSALNYTSPSYFRNPTIFVWEAQDIKEEDIKDGIILKLTFELPNEADEEFPITITCEPDTVFDKNLNPVEVTTTDALIKTISYLPGDANGDGKLNTLDITTIRRYISDNRTTDPNGYNVTICENAADVDANGRINTLDITMIRRYISDGRKTDPDGYNVTLKPGNMQTSHVHNLNYVPATPPTCEVPGNTEYWQCTSCGKYFADAEGKYEILLESTILNATHTLEHVPAKTHTCEEPGNIEYWNCLSCKKYFADAEGKNEISPESTILNATHTLEHVPAKTHTCEEPGNIEYWNCLSCKKYFADAEAKNEIPPASTVINAAHTFKHISAKTPTCEESGNIEYWNCFSCKKCFTDAEGKNEILLADTILNPAHTFEETLSYDQYGHWYNASCGHNDQLSALAEHTFVKHKCSECGADELFTVEFLDYLGSVIDVQLLTYGSAATHPDPNPERDGYIFDGWSESFNSVTENMTITPEYTKVYTVTFVDYNGAVLKEAQLVKSGESAVAPEDPTLSGYEFKGWDRKFDAVTEDITVCAIYEKIKYTVKFYMPDDTPDDLTDNILIEEQRVEHGAAAEAPTYNDQFSELYFDWKNHRMGRFSGWSQEHLENITGNVSICAEYNNDFEQPVISIVTEAGTDTGTATIRLCAPANCDVYAIDFSCKWSGNVAITGFEINSASDLYDGTDVTDEENGRRPSYNHSNKYKEFRYTWTFGTGVAVTENFATMIKINFQTDGSNSTVDKDLLTSFENCMIVYASEENASLQTIKPIIVIK